MALQGGWHFSDEVWRIWWKLPMTYKQVHYRTSMHNVHVCGYCTMKHNSLHMKFIETVQGYRQLSVQCNYQPSTRSSVLWNAGSACCRQQTCWYPHRLPVGHRFRNARLVQIVLKQWRFFWAVSTRILVPCDKNTSYLDTQLTEFRTTSQSPLSILSLAVIASAQTTISHIFQGAFKTRNNRFGKYGFQGKYNAISFMPTERATLYSPELCVRSLWWIQ